MPSRARAAGAAAGFGSVAHVGPGAHRPLHQRGRPPGLARMRRLGLPRRASPWASPACRRPQLEGRLLQRAPRRLATYKHSGRAMERDSSRNSERAAAELLQVDPAASEGEIKAQFRRMALLHHPDIASADTGTARQRRRAAVLPHPPRTAVGVLVGTGRGMPADE